MLAHDTGVKHLALGLTEAPVNQAHVLSAQGEGEDGVKLCVSQRVSRKPGGLQMNMLGPGGLEVTRQGLRPQGGTVRGRAAPVLSW